MAHELETAQAGSLGGFLRWRRRKDHAVPVGTPCANCATPLMGPWCYACGQLGEDFHRSIGHLVMEAFEGLFHLDGRLWRTIPDLAIRPGKLTRDYLDGHRAPQVPPLRLFLVVLLILFTAGSLAPAQFITFEESATKPGGHAVKVRSFKDLSPAERAEVQKSLSDVKIDFGAGSNGASSSWLGSRAKLALQNRERFLQVLETWAERFAFLMLPLAALQLSILFVFQRRFYVFDHTIFALHSLSFQGLLISATFLLGMVLGASVNALLMLAPVHLFFHMRGVYRTSVLGTLIRMALLFIGSSVGFALLLVGLLLVGLNAMSSP